MQATIPIVHLTLLRNRLPEESVFSGRTAAWLHGLDVPPCSPVEVTLPRSSCRSRIAGLQVRRSNLLPSEAAVIHDLPATSFIRTVADLGRRLPLMEGVGIVDTALHRRLVLVEHLQRWIEAHPHYKGIGRLRGVIGLADGRSESPMETRLRLLLILNGLPRPAVQVPLYDRAGLLLARTDLYYPRDRLAIEYDGATHRANLESDNRRQNRLLEAGYRLLRFSAGDILRAPASVVGQVQRALRYSSGSPN